VIKIQIVNEGGKVIDEVPAEVANCEVQQKGASIGLVFPRDIKVLEHGCRAVMFAEQVEIGAKAPAVNVKLPEQAAAIAKTKVPKTEVNSYGEA
jgi:hypothetical protein